ncbi:two-component system, sensor protein [Janibacter sp. HTCC2649]|uniref:sensor histidine kinase n=1 Tax=Janibacter sp. HTCC2649 TaxID=313589 RepID=UPI000066EFD2|nr:histidine kinase [Janibacter sp. HTCC2649]EAP96924.1 two-component system, sensor protein [Janibacter sp. HTCC2649]
MTDVWGDQRATRRQLVLDIVGAVLFGLVMLAIHVSLGMGAAIATVLLAVALAFRRVSWQVMSVFAFAGAVSQVVGSDIAYLANAAYAVCFFTLGSHRDARVRKFGLVGAGVAVAGAATYGLLRGAGDIASFAGWATAIGLGSTAALFVFGGWVAGYLRWQSRQTIQARVDAQLEAVERRRVTELYDIEQERRRIAADMHDVVAHSWAVVAAQSDGARYALQDNPAGAERALEVIGETARTAITDLRTIVAQLRDPALQPSTPGYAQQAELVDRMRASGMALDLTETGTRNESPLIALTAHRLLGESLTNALKHGDLSAPVHVAVDWTDGYRLHVTNHVNGSAVDPPSGGHGLVGMAERTTVAGGTFAAGREGDRWIVDAHIPGSPA